MAGNRRMEDEVPPNSRFRDFTRLIRCPRSGLSVFTAPARFIDTGGF